MDAILNGPRSAILFSLIKWSDRPKVAIPWTKIATKAGANAIAAAIRKLPRNEGEFTCMANMLRFVSDKIVTQIPAQATISMSPATARTIAMARRQLTWCAMSSWGMAP